MEILSMEVLAKDIVDFSVIINGKNINGTYYRANNQVICGVDIDKKYKEKIKSACLNELDDFDKRIIEMYE